MFMNIWNFDVCALSFLSRISPSRFLKIASIVIATAGSLTVFSCKNVRPADRPGDRPPPCHAHMSRSYVTLICHAHMSRSCATLMCHGHVLRSRVTLTCHAHMKKKKTKMRKFPCGRIICVNFHAVALRGFSRLTCYCLSQIV